MLEKKGMAVFRDGGGVSVIEILASLCFFIDDYPVTLLTYTQHSGNLIYLHSTNTNTNPSHQQQQF